MLTSKEKDEIEKLVKIGFSQRQIEKQTLISRTTISSFISRSLKENKNGSSMGRPEKINKDQKEYIIGLVEFNPFITLREIKDMTYDIKKLDVSTSSISRLLLNEKITVKRTQIIPVERNSPRTIELRFDYVNKFYELSREIININFIYADESGFNMHITNEYGRARAGVSPIAEIPASKGKN